LLCLDFTAPLQGQTAREVENLRAFTKLFGYVRYFHPADASAEVPWDAFAVHGVRQVKAARTADELRRILERLFQPIAPTVQIFPARAAPPAARIRPPSDPTGLVTVAWQHLGLGLMGQSVYRSVRVNRDNPAPSAGGFGTVTGSVDAAPYRGKTVRLRGWVRADVAGSANRGQLWLRVDRPGRERGFFDNMGDRPITAREWRPYEIVGQVAENASRIAFGCFLMGRGTVWVDDLELSVRNARGEWTPIPLGNSSFEEADEAGKPRGWFTGTPGYTFTVVRGDAHSGDKALAIQRGAAAMGAPLFPQWPQVGDAVVKQLGVGLAARVPLALDGNDRTAHGSTKAPPFVALMTDLRRVGVDTLNAGDEALRLADVVIAWNVFQHFYPYFDVVPGNWDGELTIALEDALDDRSAGDFLHTLNRLVAALHDGHASVTLEGTAWGHIPVGVDWIEDQVVVTRVTDTTLHPGDIVLALDGGDAVEAVHRRETEMSGSPQWKRSRSMREFGFGYAGTEATLRVRRGTRTFQVALRRTLEPFPERDGAPVRALDPGIWYVDLDRAEMPAIRARLDELARARGVIFDLRGYPKGNHAVLSHLLTAPDTSRAWMHVPKVIYPDRERPAGTTPHGWGLRPAEPRISGRVVFLTDGRAISYAESFMSFVEHYRLAEIVGQPTAGTNGNVNVLTLPGGYQVPWTGMRVVKHDGSPHHLVGIQPTIRVTRTIEGVHAGRDEFLERALAVIRGTRE
jgi:C-terminal processing protease CtpA/Prc